MLRNPDLPLLPGFAVKNEFRKNFHLPQNWNYVNGTSILVEKDHCNISGEQRDNIFKKPTLYPPHTGPQIPDWLNYDRKILCFTGYFREELHEIYQAPYQIRQVKILFYLEDGTIQVIEPRVNNSGISQGCIVSRQRVPCLPPHRHEFLSILDFNLQQTVNIFDRIYNIIDCDEFTRKFLNRAGIAVAKPLEIPDDPAQMMRKQMDDSLKPKKSKAKNDAANKLEKFLNFDKLVLKFDAYWDDRSSSCGDIRELIVYYYLADDTIQINEKVKLNSGRSASGTFLKRQHLPKEWNGVPLLGQQSNFTVLNVLGGGFMKGRYLRDSLGVGSQKSAHYKDEDLRIGTILNVFGRDVVLINCDKFTQHYYRSKYGIEEFIALPKPEEPANRFKYRSDERILPPFNGWGTHEDSEGNCITVEPKPPHRDFTKFIKLDQCKLRFGAQMLSDVLENNERIFLITYYLSDDTISVYEVSGRNSGFTHGEFYKRAKFYLPDQDWLSSERPKPLNSQHFYIGSTIRLKDYTFQLINADEFSLKYMETFPFEYPMSNINLIMNKIKMAIEPIYKDFIGKYIGDVTIAFSTSTENKCQKTFICFKTMRTALIELLDHNITEHEIITFMRHFAAKSSENSLNQCDRNVIQSLVHLELNRNLWDDLTRLKEYIYHLDPINFNGYLPEKQLHSIVLACRLPIKSILIENMFSVLNKKSNGAIEVRDFLDFIDRFRCKSAPIQPTNLYNVCSNDTTNGIQLINWSAFIDELGLETDLKRETE